MSVAHTNAPVKRDRFVSSLRSPHCSCGAINMKRKRELRLVMREVENAEETLRMLQEENARYYSAALVWTRWHCGSSIALSQTAEGVQ